MSSLVYSRSEFRILLPLGFWDSLLSELRQIRWPGPELLDGEQAVVLDGGMGPGWLLTSSGHLFAHWEEPLIISLGDAYRAVVVGWRKTKLDLLLTLLPERPPLARDCPKCQSNRFFVVNPDADHDRQISIVCDQCNGLSWLEDSSEG